MAQTYNGSLTGIPSIQVDEKAPLDVRTVVDNYSDLITKWDGVTGHPGIQNLYTGIIVFVKETSSIYALIGTPKNSNKPESWKLIDTASGYATKDWVEGQGYLTAEDIPDFLTDSDLDDFAKKSDIPSVEGLASESWVESQGYLKSEDIPDYLTDSDLDEFAKKSDIPSVEGLASESWVEGQGYLTQHQDISNKADKSELPTKVSDLTNDEGYLTANDLPDYLTDSDLDEFAKKSDIPSVEGLASQSWVEGQGYLTQHQDISNKADKSEIPTEGVFPDVEGSDDSDAGINGFATVDGVVAYVNALLEKKKIEGESIPYAYITGYGLSDTATDITQFNPFELNETGDTTIEFYGPQELPLYDQNDNELPCFKVTMDLPDGYEISEFYIWNSVTNQYQTTPFGQNLRYTTRVINGVTYNSYVRGPANSIQPRGTSKYKIIITKQ